MTGVYVLGVAAATVITGFIFVMLRRGYLREKFAALWLAVAGVIMVLSVFPGVLAWFARSVGVEVPANLLFLMAALLLLLVGVQLSYEVGRLDTRTQRLAEEVALLRSELEDLQAPPSDRGEPGRGPGSVHGPV